MGESKTVDFELILKFDGYTYLTHNSIYVYYVSGDGKLSRRSTNTFKELGYIEDNMRLYRRLCEGL